MAPKWSLFLYLSVSVFLYFGSVPVASADIKFCPFKVKDWFTSKHALTLPTSKKIEEGFHHEALHALTSHCCTLLSFLPFLSLYLSLWSNQHALSPFYPKWFTEQYRYSRRKSQGGVGSVTSRKAGSRIYLSSWFPPKQTWEKEAFSLGCNPRK